VPLPPTSDPLCSGARLAKRVAIGGGFREGLPVKWARLVTETALIVSGGCVMPAIVHSDREDLQNLLAQLVENKVRTLAYELYEVRGKVDGRTLEDWLKAESEVWALPKR
jgi:Protein of unknown function (DUF2934)